MRSDAIDQLMSTYLQQPAKVSWNGAIADSVRGIFEGGRIELAGVSVLALPFDRIIPESDRFQFTPGLPAKFDVSGPRIEVSLDQRQINRWLARSRAPFTLKLTSQGIESEVKLAGLPLNRTLTTLEMRGGWLVLRPQESRVLGVNARLARLFRSYLPIPRLSQGAAISEIRHARGSVRIGIQVDDFQEEITPGLVDRLRARFYPFAKPSSDPPPP